MRNKDKEGYVYKIICDTPADHVVYVGQTTQSLSGRLSHHAAKQQHPTKLNTYIRALGKQHFKIYEIEKVFGRQNRTEREVYWTRQLCTSADCCNVRSGFSLTDAEKGMASRNNYRNRAVVCHNDGHVFMSCSAAARFYKRAVSDVSECCAMHLKQAGGFYFRYQDVDPEKYLTYWSTGIRRRLRVLVVETGVIYPSVREASIALGVHGATIRKAGHNNKCIRGVHIKLVQ